MVLLADGASIAISEEESALLSIVQYLEGVDRLVLVSILVFEEVSEF